MTNQNGQLILKALQNLNEPCTISKIIEHVAESAGVHTNDVKDTVYETVKAGHRYGYIQLRNRKYFAAPLEMNDLVVDHQESDHEVSNELQDKTRRSRRTASGRKPIGRRSRSGRRRSRSGRRRSRSGKRRSRSSGTSQ